LYQRKTRNCLILLIKVHLGLKAPLVLQVLQVHQVDQDHLEMVGQRRN
jgi:hypothetical protein